MASGLVQMLNLFSDNSPAGHSSWTPLCIYNTWTFFFTCILWISGSQLVLLPDVTLYISGDPTQ